MSYVDCNHLLLLENPRPLVIQHTTWAFLNVGSVSKALLENDFGGREKAKTNRKQ